MGHLLEGLREVCHCYVAPNPQQANLPSLLRTATGSPPPTSHLPWLQACPEAALSPLYFGDTCNPSHPKGYQA